MDLSSLCKQNMFSNLKPKLMSFYYCDSILFWLQMCLFSCFHDIFLSRDESIKYFLSRQNFWSRLAFSCHNSLCPVGRWNQSSISGQGLEFRLRNQFSGHVSTVCCKGLKLGIFSGYEINFPVTDKISGCGQILAQVE